MTIDTNITPVTKPKAIAGGQNGTRKSKGVYAGLRRYRRFGAYMSYRREVEEYLEQARKMTMLCICPFRAFSVLR